MAFGPATGDPEKAVYLADPPNDSASDEGAHNRFSPVSSHAELDDTYDVYRRNADLDVTPEEARRVLRKIDYRIVTILFVSYMLQYLDKNSQNFAVVYGLEQGTNLHGQDYSWLGTYVLLQGAMPGSSDVSPAA